MSYSQGVSEYRLRNPKKDELVISCGESTASAGETLFAVEVSIGGNPPPPHHQVKFTIGEQEIVLATMEGGVIDQAHQDFSEAYVRLWKSMLAGSTLRISFADGRSATFALKGAARVLGPEPSADCR